MPVQLPRISFLLHLSALTVGSLAASILTAAGSDRSNGFWAPIGPPGARYEHTAIYDPVGDRMILYGGRLSDLWVLSFGGNPGWTQLPIISPCPASRYGHSAIYDPVRQRMIVFGGHDQNRHFNDVWALSLSGSPTWTPITPSGTPPQCRYDHTAVYDPAHDVMIVFGGCDHTVLLGDVWILSLSGTPAWSRLALAEADSMRRYRHAAIFDSARDRMVVVGGSDGTRSCETWVLSLSGVPAWSRVVATGAAPTPRARHAAAFDPAGDRMVVFGGTDGSRRNDTWALSLRDLKWSRLEPDGTRPSRRNESSAVLDSRCERLVIFGGYEEDLHPLGDTWALSLRDRPEWTQLNASMGSPPNHYGDQAVAYDSRRDRLIMVGGSSAPYPVDATYALQLGGAPGWTRLAPIGPGPGARMLSAAVYDPVRDRVIVIGGLGWLGYRDSYITFDDVWSLSMDDPPRWSRLSPSGPTPPARAAATAIYDPIKDRVILSGGSTELGYYDAWELSLSEPMTWVELRAAGNPPRRRYRQSVAYDPVRNRMIVFAGQRDTLGNAASPADTWALTLDETPTWSEITPTVRPYWAGASQATIYDPIRDRLVTFLDWGLEVWALDLSDPREWTRLAPAGAPPFFRRSGVYDPIRDRMILAGGTFETPWALTWGEPIGPGVIQSGEATWRGSDTLELSYRLVNPLPGDRMIEWNLTADPSWPGLPLRGSVNVRPRGEAPLRLSIPVPVDPAPEVVTLRMSTAFAGAAGNEVQQELVLEVPRSSEFAVHCVLPNPSAGGLSLFFTLPAAGAVRMSVHDISGRRVGPEREATLNAGHHVWPVESGRILPPGVYVVRLAFGGRSLAAGAVVIR